MSAPAKSSDNPVRQHLLPTGRRSENCSIAEPETRSNGGTPVSAEGAENPAAAINNLDASSLAQLRLFFMLLDQCDRQETRVSGEIVSGEIQKAECTNEQLPHPDAGKARGLAPFVQTATTNAVQQKLSRFDGTLSLMLPVRAKNEEVAA